MDEIEICAQRRVHVAPPPATIKPGVSARLPPPCACYLAPCGRAATAPGRPYPWRGTGGAQLAAGAAARACSWLLRTCCCRPS
jgi:hypothetical protein